MSFAVFVSIILFPPMKKLLLLIALSLVCQIGYAQKKSTKSAPCKVVVDGIVEVKGMLMIGIYNSEDSHMLYAFKGFDTPVTAKTMVVELKNIPDGDYSIAVFQDMNKNRFLDKNFIGKPTERCGFSNNAHGFMSPPSWKKAKVRIEKNKTIRITIK